MPGHNAANSAPKHHAVAACVARERGQPHGVFAGSALQAQLVEVFGRDAREDRDCQDSGRFDAEFGRALAGSFDRGGKHVGAAERMDGEQRDPGTHQRPHRRMHRARNVVELHVEHVTRAGSFQPREQRVAETIERLVADLEHDVESGECINQALRSFQCRNVERDDESRGHAADLASGPIDPST